MRWVQPVHHMHTTCRKLNITCALPGATWDFTGFLNFLLISHANFHYLLVRFIANQR